MQKSIGESRRAARSGKPTKGQYQPDRSDFVYLDFTPHAGREQGGRRPAIVLSPAAYNTATGLAWVCPITNQVKGSPWEITLPGGVKVSGCILADQLRSLDWLERNAEFLGKAPTQIIDDVLALIDAVLHPSWQAITQ